MSAEAFLADVDPFAASRSERLSMWERHVGQALDEAASDLAEWLEPLSVTSATSQWQTATDGELAELRVVALITTPPRRRWTEARVQAVGLWIGDYVEANCPDPQFGWELTLHCDDPSYPRESGEAALRIASGAYRAGEYGKRNTQRSGVRTVAEPDPHDIADALEAKRAGKLREAATRLEAYLRSNPDSTRAHEVLAWTLAAMKDSANASVHFRRVTELAPGTEQAEQAQRALERLR